MEERKETRRNEKVGKERGKGEHEEERHGAVLQAQQKQSQFLLKALTRVCYVGHRDSQIGGNEMNLEVITVQDCIDMFDLKDQSTIINDGKVIGFKGKENPHTDR